jgi:DNA-binding PadR family transcriptional regulator
MMARRRKVANLLGLAVLGTVVTKPMHPYEMASVLRERGKDQDIEIKWGSLYRVVQNLEKYGLLQATQSERHGGRPERTVYRITDAGRAELVDWVRELVGVPEREMPKFKAGLSFLGVLSPDEVIDLFRQRIRALDAQIAAARADLVAYTAEIPRLFLIEAEYDLAIRTAEANWVRGLLREMTEGSMPGLAQWRDFHRTGEMPPEVAGLAERGTDRDDPGVVLPHPAGVKTSNRTRETEIRPQGGNRKDS